MEPEIKEQFNNEDRPAPELTVTENAFAWMLARLQEPSSMIGIAAMVSSLGWKIDPAKAGAITTAALFIGGFLAFVLREKKHLYFEDLKTHHKKINWAFLSGWLIARLKERTSQVGLIMIAAGFGVNLSEEHVSTAVTVITFLAGSAAFASKEGGKTNA
jgi:hypothetical protein